MLEDARFRAQFGTEVLNALQAGEIDESIEQAFFAALVKNWVFQGRIEWEPKYHTTAKLLSDKARNFTSQNFAELENRANALSKELQVDWASFYRILDRPLPLKLPLEEYDSAEDYLFNAYIANSDISSPLAAHYKKGFVKYINLIGIETVYNTFEIGLFWGELASNVTRATFLADVVLGTTIDCAEEYRKSGRSHYYEDAISLHLTVQDTITRINSNLKNLQNFSAKQIAKAGLEPRVAKAAQQSLDYSLRYSEQRERLKAYATSMKEFSEKALKNSQSGDSNIIDERIKSAMKTGLNVKKFVTAHGFELCGTIFCNAFSRNAV